MAYTKYSLTPANNTAAPPDGAPEGMLPSAVNDTMRDMMAQIRDCGDGVRDGTYTMTAVKITGGTINGATIGATTASTGAFTSITASTTLGITGVATFSAGSAAAPAITTTGDTNTGIFFPAADTIAFTEGGAEAMRINSSGNVGIGTSSPASFATVKALQLNTASTLMAFTDEFDMGQNVYYNAGNKYITTGAATLYAQTGGQHQWYYAASGTAGNAISFSQGMLLDSSGNLLVGTTSQFAFATSRLAIGYSTSDFVTAMQNSNASPFGMYIKYSGASPNGASNEFIYCHDGTLRFSVMSNGGISNFSANNSNLSDEREKKNIELAPNYLDKICQIPIKTFLYNDQTDTDLNLGVIAQDVEAICPELIMESNWGTKEEPKIRKSIYQTDLQYALMKCIQEQQALIESLTTRLSALENK